MPQVTGALCALGPDLRGRPEGRRCHVPGSASVRRPLRGPRACPEVFATPCRCARAYSAMAVGGTVRRRCCARGAAQNESRSQGQLSGPHVRAVRAKVLGVRVGGTKMTLIPATPTGRGIFGGVFGSHVRRDDAFTSPGTVGSGHRHHRAPGRRGGQPRQNTCLQCPRRPRATGHKRARSGRLVWRQATFGAQIPRFGRANWPRGVCPVVRQRPPCRGAPVVGPAPAPTRHAR